MINSLPLESLSPKLTHILHSAAASSFPYTKHSNQGKLGSMPQNKWYDEDSRDLHRKLTVSQLNGSITVEIQAQHRPSRLKKPRTVG